MAAVDEAWRPMREAAARIRADQFDLVTTSGWTVKEMLAHIAFWDEAVTGVLVGMFRKEPLPDGWRFGSGFLPGEGEGWPPAEVHNEREAAWARGQDPAGVLARLEQAHGQMVAILATVTDEEAREHAGYFDGLSSHYTEHLPELDGLG
ncbi:MAG: DinB family protein [Actinomycetota bacterium]